MDTIYALATAPGRAGIAVVRISGPDAWAACDHLTGSTPEARRTSLRLLKDAAGRVLDQAVVIAFAEGASYTGEPMLELHLHGSMAVWNAVLRELSTLPGFRPADPGEFTRRALENDRLDLEQVEGLADLIDAETEAQRDQAIRALSGALGQVVEGWRSRLLRAAALLEATIDFADEDVPVDVMPEVSALLDEVARALKSELSGIEVAERIREGFEVAIVGAPNAGKSTLLNALAGRDAAITSETAGTTRDVIEVRMDIRGIPVTILDTAGLRETEDAVEGLGIARARQRADRADLRVVLVEGGVHPDISLRDDDLVLNAKADLSGGPGISGLTGQGVPELLDAIADALSARSAGAGVATRERHRIAMERAGVSLDEAVSLLDLDHDTADLAAEELRSAVRSLESLIGRIDVESVLGEIFSRFCIGK